MGFRGGRPDLAYGIQEFGPWVQTLVSLGGKRSTDALSVTIKSIAS
jgi:hypothetical protein